MITISDPKPARRPKVYVVQDVPGRNTTSLLDFGDPVAVLSADDEARMLNTPNIVFKLKRGLQRFNRDDYLVLMGSPVSIGIACAIVSDLTGGTFRLLKWDNQERRYFPVSVNVKE